MLRMAKTIPLLRFAVIGQLGLLAYRHVKVLTPTEQRRLVELARRPHKLSAPERAELKSLSAKLEPGAFARSAVGTVSPFGGRRGKRR